MVFTNRYQAGGLLSEKLLIYRKKALVLAIPRGGVVVAKPIANKLQVPLDIIVTRKLPSPFQEELAIGAVGPEGVVVLDNEIIDTLQIEKDYLASVTKKKTEEVEERLAKYREGKKAPDIKDKTIILVDDGIATGATVEAAIKYLKIKKANKIVLAVPVAPKSFVDKFKNITDEFITLHTPSSFQAVGQFYKSFIQVTDDKVIQLLQIK